MGMDAQLSAILGDMVRITLFREAFLARLNRL